MLRVSSLVMVVVADLVAFWTAFLVVEVVLFFLVPVTLPVTVLSLGLFLFIVNAVIIEMADGLLGGAFEVESFGWALLFSLLLTLFNYLLELPNRRRQAYRGDDSAARPQQEDDHFDDYEEVE